MYWMYAIEDGEINRWKGDSGGLSVSYPTVDGNISDGDMGVSPEVGRVMQVGSNYGRTFSVQDWWLTTIIQEILEDKTVDGRRQVLFKTRNSTYLWKDDG